MGYSDMCSVMILCSSQYDLGPPLWSSVQSSAANPEVTGLIPGSTRFSE
jgi:hypothetical protein